MSISEALAGRYTYCVADGAYPRTLRATGIDGSPVYGVSFRGISAVVHRCSLKPYQSRDAQQVRKWVAVHQRVIESCLKRLGSVVPLTFDTIIRDGDKGVKRWLNDDHERLKEKLRRLKGKVEYGIQIFWNPKAVGLRLAEENGRIKELRLLRKRSLEGMAYLLEKKIERELASELQKKGELLCRDSYSKITGAVDAISVDPVKRARGEQQMLMNLSVLLTKGKHGPLGKVLTEIKERNGFKVRFTGPWPPYSFV